MLLRQLELVDFCQVLWYQLQVETLIKPSKSSKHYSCMCIYKQKEITDSVKLWCNPEIQEMYWVRITWLCYSIS